MRKLLIISAPFPPGCVIGAHRPTKLARRIEDFGWRPYVLTMAKACQFPVDPTFGVDVLDRVPVTRVPCWSPWLHAEKSLLNNRWDLRLLATKVFNRLTHRFLPVDSTYPWASAAVDAGVRLVRDQEIDLIWATCRPWSDMVLGSRIARKTGVPFVVDFRDVLMRVPRAETGSSRWCAQIEDGILRDAAGVTYVAPDQRNVLIHKHPRLADTPLLLATNWFEADDSSGQLPPRTFDRPTLLHGGSLYGGQRLVDGLLDALTILKTTGSQSGRNAQFVQCGGGEGMGFLQSKIAKKGLDSAARIEPSLRRGEFIAACRGAAILVLVVGHDIGIRQRDQAIPGKLYDYFLARRPILVIGPADCQAGRMVTQTRSGMAVRDDSPEEIAQAIETLLQGQGRSGPLDMSYESVSDFEASTVVQKLAAFFNSLLETRRA